MGTLGGFPDPPATNSAEQSSAPFTRSKWEPWEGSRTVPRLRSGGVGGWGVAAQLADPGAAERRLGAGRIRRDRFGASGVGAPLLAILFVALFFLLGDGALLAAFAAGAA